MPEQSVGIQSKLPDANRGYLPGSCLSNSLGLLLQGADHGSACPDFRYRGAWSLGRAFHSLIHILRQPSRFVRTTLHATSLLGLEMKGKSRGKNQIRYLPYLEASRPLRRLSLIRDPSRICLASSSSSSSPLVCLTQNSSCNAFTCDILHSSSITGPSISFHKSTLVHRYSAATLSSTCHIDRCFVTSGGTNKREIGEITVTQWTSLKAHQSHLHQIQTSNPGTSQWITSSRP